MYGMSTIIFAIVMIKVLLLLLLTEFSQNCFRLQAACFFFLSNTLFYPCLVHPAKNHSSLQVSARVSQTTAIALRREHAAQQRNESKH